MSRSSSSDAAVLTRAAQPAGLEGEGRARRVADARQGVRADRDHDDDGATDLVVDDVAQIEDGAAA